MIHGRIYLSVLCISRVCLFRRGTYIVWNRNILPSVSSMYIRWRQESSRTRRNWIGIDFSATHSASRTAIRSSSDFMFSVGIQPFKCAAAALLDGWRVSFSSQNYTGARMWDSFPSIHYNEWLWEICRAVITEVRSGGTRHFICSNIV